MLPETRALSSGRYAGAAVAIVALAAVLRFYKLGEWSMWVDEGMTYVRAVTGNLSDQGPLYATAPLNFLVTRAIISAFQPSLFWLRFFPAVCGVLGVAAILWSGSRLGGPVAGLVAGLLLALSPWHIDWSQNARHFSAVFLFMVVAVTGFFLFWESGRIRWLLASGVASALGLLTHSSSLFVLVGMGMYAAILVLLRPYRTAIVTRRKLIATAAFFVILVGAYAPIALSVSQYLGAHKTAWNPPSNVAASILFYLGPLELALAGLAGLLGAWRGRRGALLALQCLCWPRAGRSRAAPTRCPPWGVPSCWWACSSATSGRTSAARSVWFSWPQWQPSWGCAPASISRRNKGTDLRGARRHTG